VTFAEEAVLLVADQVEEPAEVVVFAGVVDDHSYSHAVCPAQGIDGTVVDGAALGIVVGIVVDLEGPDVEAAV